MRPQRLAASLLLAAICLPSLAQDQPKAEPTPAYEASSKIIDDAGLFGASARAKAGTALLSLERATRVPIVIEAIDAHGSPSIDEAALDRARASGTKGIFLLISQADREISRPLVHKDFAGKVTEEDRGKIRDAIIADFERGRFGDGLIAAVRAIGEALDEEELPVVAETRADEATTAPEPPLIRRGLVGLNLAGAELILKHSREKAVEMGLKNNIAVVDDGGHLIAFVRMDGARPASGYTAITKATTAATFRQPTGPLPAGGEPNVLLNLSLQNAAAASGGKITTLYGGVPIVIDGQVIGAVGVGGGTGEQDAQVARAGIDALIEALKIEAP